jgi:predicted transposase/invertase (TIGR01784 family)
VPEGIAYQNKDIEFKLMSETYKEKSFDAYGLKLPKIKEVLPTNLPAVSANEMRIDNLFLLEDDTVAIVDYESEDKTSNRVKYINYIGRIMQRYDSQGIRIPELRMIVIYTGDVETAKDTWEIPCLTLKMEQVFIHSLPDAEIYQSVKKKLENNETLSEKELMQLIILPLAKKGKEAKQKMIEQVVDLAKQIEDENTQAFVITGILVSSDKFIDRDYAKSVRRYLSMTKVFQILEEEKQEAINIAEKEGQRKSQLQIAENLIKAGADILMIMKGTGLTKEEIEEIKKNMMVTK